jgi:hypothetical protein
MKVIFDKLAKLELDDASEFYEFEVPGLGDRFREEVKRGIRRICEYPSAWTREREDVRRYILHKFPYKILYSIEEDYIYIYGRPPAIFFKVFDLSQFNVYLNG